MTITEYTGKNRIVVIPKEFNDCPIVSVSEGAFAANLHINEVYFTSPIEIKPAAFQNCLNIKKLILVMLQELALMLLVDQEFVS